MSEEKKIIELNDKELEKVNGGFETELVTVTSYSFTAGDCFVYGPQRIRVVESHNNVLSGQSIIVELSQDNAPFHQTSFAVYDIMFRKENFVGNNVF